jgi:hypothetical protein
MRKQKYNTIEIDTKYLKQELLDPDQYPAEVVDIRPMGNTFLVSYHVLDQGTGDVLTNVTDKIKIDTAGLKRLGKFLHAIGQNVPETGTFTTDPSEWIGKLCVVELNVMELQDDSEVNVIAGYYRFEESSLGTKKSE